MSREWGYNCLGLASDTGNTLRVRNRTQVRGWGNLYFPFPRAWGPVASMGPRNQVIGLLHLLL